MKYVIKQNNKVVHGPFVSPEIELKKFLEEFKIRNAEDFRKKGYTIEKIENGKRVVF